MIVILTFLNTRSYTLGLHLHTPMKLMVMWLFPDRVIKGKSQKRLKDDYGRLIDFLGQIWKLSSFNLLDLADILMHL